MAGSGEVFPRHLIRFCCAVTHGTAQLNDAYLGNAYRIGVLLLSAQNKSPKIHLINTPKHPATHHRAPATIALGKPTQDSSIQLFWRIGLYNKFLFLITGKFLRVQLQLPVSLSWFCSLRSFCSFSCELVLERARFGPLAQVSTHRHLWRAIISETNC